MNRIRGNVLKQLAVRFIDREIRGLGWVGVRKWTGEINPLQADHRYVASRCKGGGPSFQMAQSPEL